MSKLNSRDCLCIHDYPCIVCCCPNILNRVIPLRLSRAEAKWCGVVMKTDMLICGRARARAEWDTV